MEKKKKIGDGRRSLKQEGKTEMKEGEKWEILGGRRESKGSDALLEVDCEIQRRNHTKYCVDKRNKNVYFIATLSFILEKPPNKFDAG